MVHTISCIICPTDIIPTHSLSYLNVVTVPPRSHQGPTPAPSPVTHDLSKIRHGTSCATKHPSRTMRWFHTLYGTKITDFQHCDRTLRSWSQTMLQFHVIIIIVILSIICSDRPCHSFLQPRVRHKTNCGHFSISPLPSLARSTPLKKKTKFTGTDDLPDLNNTAPQLDEQHLIQRLGISYAQKVMELSRFKSENGHCLVPKRYDKNPSLGNWVNKQRQLYRKYLMGDTSSMTKVSLDCHLCALSSTSKCSREFALRV
jgi:hypothetical protein